MNAKRTRKSKRKNRGAPEARPLLPGAVLLAVALALSLVLSLHELGSLALPGCGETGGCADAARSRWGRVPGLGWPVSFVGLAYFAALLGGWITSRGALSAPLRAVVRVGAVLSVAFLGAMAVGGYLCLYCLGTHAANLAFWVLVERASAGARERRPLVTSAAVFASVTVALLLVRTATSREVRERLDRQADASVQEMLEDTRDATAGRGAADGGGFTGRHRTGPEQAAVRMVIISDYQCPDCRAVELVARQVLAEHDSVSLSAKHFPFDSTCNPNVGRSLHPNACWAARAVEAAGIVGGDEAFWSMHEWLFDRGGSFTAPELREGLASLGLDADEFLPVMESDETLALVQADIAEAIDLGLHFTPMIFLNGVQLRGVFAQNADKLAQAVGELIAAGAPPRTAAGDRPPLADAKAVGDWREQRVTGLPPERPDAPTLGPAGAGIRITVWGDYQEQRLPAVDREIREWMNGRDDARYVFRHYPYDEQCNDTVPRTVFPHGCRAALIAEAAGRVAGRAGFWRMHDWLLSHQDPLPDEKLLEAAEAVGIDPARLREALHDPTVAQAVIADAHAAKASKTQRWSYLYRNAVPTIYVDDRVVPRWEVGGESVLTSILNAAAAGE